jgi:hypothetical protein
MDPGLVAIIVAIIVAVPPTVIGVLNLRNVKSLHVLINSNLSRQIADAVAAAHAQGVNQGVSAERKRKPRS